MEKKKKNGLRFRSYKHIRQQSLTFMDGGGLYERLIQEGVYFILGSFGLLIIRKAEQNGIYIGM